MERKILVFLKHRNQIDKVMPYIEKLAKSETSVVFILRPRAPHWEWIAGYWSFAHTGIESSFREAVSNHLAEINRERSLVNDVLARWSRRVSDKRLRFDISIFTGSLNQIVESAASTDQVQLVITPAPRAFPLMGLSSLLRPFGFRHWGWRIPPVLLTHG
jgi:hypothetical protein